MKDAIKYCKSLYTFSNIDVFSNEEGEHKVFETNEPIAKFITELITKTREKPVNLTGIVQTYFIQKAINVKKIFLILMKIFYDYYFF